MSEETFHITEEDIRKAESRESRKHHGMTPPDSSEVSILKSIVDKHRASNPEDKIVNLELPEQPHGESELKSADARYHVGTGSGRTSGGIETDPFRDPAVVDVV